MDFWHFLDVVERMHKCSSAERSSYLNIDSESRKK